MSFRAQRGIFRPDAREDPSTPLRSGRGDNGRYRALALQLRMHKTGIIGQFGR